MRPKLGASFVTSVASGSLKIGTDAGSVYAVNAVNVSKATNQATLAGQSVTLNYEGPALSYTLGASTATIQPNGLTYNSAAKQFSVNYPGGAVTYTVGAGGVTDNRLNQSTFPSALIRDRAHRVPPPGPLGRDRQRVPQFVRVRSKT